MLWLKEDADIVMFLDSAKKCKGDISLCTKEGDRLNLKSVLTQYICVVLANEKDILTGSHILLGQESDKELLGAFLEEGEPAQ